MKNISLKIDENIFKETEAILSKLKKSRNKYINEALDYYNHIQSRKALQAILKEESALVTESSKEALREFEAIDYEG